MWPGHGHNTVLCSIKNNVHIFSLVHPFVHVLRCALIEFLNPNVFVAELNTLKGAKRWNSRTSNPTIRCACIRCCRPKGTGTKTKCIWFPLILFFIPEMIHIGYMFPIIMIYDIITSNVPHHHVQCLSFPPRVHVRSFITSRTMHPCWTYQRTCALCVGLTHDADNVGPWARVVSIVSGHAATTAI